MEKFNHIIVALLISTTTLLGQSKSTITEMKGAMALHEAATNYEEEQAAANKSKAISDSNPKEWLPAYWTAYLYSQAGRMSKDKIAHYEIGFEYLNKASKLLQNPTNEEISYVSALESLLSTLSQGPNFAKGNIEKGKLYAVQQNSAINAGLNAKNESPLLLVLVGTNLIGEGFRAKPSADISKLITGKILLERAKEIYATTSTKDPLLPNRWNEPWIDVWLNRLKKTK